MKSITIKFKLFHKFYDENKLMKEYIEFTEEININENETIFNLLNKMKEDKVVEKIANKGSVFFLGDYLNMKIPYLIVNNRVEFDTPIENVKIIDYLNTFKNVNEPNMLKITSDIGFGASGLWGKSLDLNLFIMKIIKKTCNNIIFKFLIKIFKKKIIKKLYETEILNHIQSVNYFIIHERINSSKVLAIYLFGSSNFYNIIVSEFIFNILGFKKDIIRNRYYYVKKDNDRQLHDLLDCIVELQY